MTTALMGHQAELAVSALSGNTNDITTDSQRIEFDSTTLKATHEILDGTGIRGTRGRYLSRRRRGITRVGGNLTLTPGPTELSFFLPRIFGSSTGTPIVYSMAETIPQFAIGIDEGFTKTHKYQGLKVDRAVFRCQRGGFLSLSMDLVGKTETAVGSTFETLSVPATYAAEAPFTIMDADNAGTSRLVLGGSAFEFDRFELTIDNGLLKDRFNHQYTASDIPEGDRNVTIMLECPYNSSNAGLYYDFSAATTANMPISLLLPFINGNVSLQFGASTTFKFTRPPEKPGVEGRSSERIISINGAFGIDAGQTSEITATLDLTP